MRIVINAISASFGGGAVYIKYQLSALLEKDINNNYTIFVSKKNRYDILQNKHYANLRVISIPHFPYPLRILLEQLFLPVFNLLNRTDILYCPGNYSIIMDFSHEILVFQNPNLFFKINQKIPITLSIKRFFQKLMAIASMLKAYRIIFISNNLMEKATKGRLGEKSRLVYSGFNRVENVVNINTNIYKPYILAVSNFSYHKNYPALFEAFKILAYKYNFNGKLVIAGKVIDKAYMETITKGIRDDKKLKNSIVFLGSVEHNKLPDLYKNALAYVSTSVLEAFPLTPFEAMYYGAPIVISRATSFPEICGNAAYYVNPTNPVDIADGLYRVISSSQLREKLIKNGHKRILDFTWAKNAERILNIFNEVKTKK